MIASGKNLISMANAIIFAACFACVLSGCTPTPPLVGIHLQNESDKEIYVYTPEPFQSATVPGGQSRYLKTGEPGSFNVFVPGDGRLFAFNADQSGYSISDLFSSGRYQPLAWSKENQLFMLDLDGNHIEQVSCEYGVKKLLPLQDRPDQLLEITLTEGPNGGAVWSVDGKTYTDDSDLTAHLNHCDTGKGVLFSEVSKRYFPNSMDAIAYELHRRGIPVYRYVPVNSALHAEFYQIIFEEIDR